MKYIAGGGERTMFEKLLEVEKAAKYLGVSEKDRVKRSVSHVLSKNTLCLQLKTRAVCWSGNEHK